MVVEQRQSLANFEGDTVTGKHHQQISLRLVEKKSFLYRYFIVVAQELQ